MRELTNTVGVGVGDVVIVARHMMDKKPKEPYVWRWFGVVVEVRRTTLEVIRVGDPDDDPAQGWRISRDDPRTTARLLALDEIPPAIHAWKMREAMLGRLNI